MASVGCHDLKTSVATAGGGVSSTPSAKPFLRAPPIITRNSRTVCSTLYPPSVKSPARARISSSPQPSVTQRPVSANTLSCQFSPASIFFIRSWSSPFRRSRPPTKNGAAVAGRATGFGGKARPNCPGIYARGLLSSNVLNFVASTTLPFLTGHAIDPPSRITRPGFTTEASPDSASHKAAFCVRQISGSVSGVSRRQWSCARVCGLVPVTTTPVGGHPVDLNLEAAFPFRICVWPRCLGTVVPHDLRRHSLRE